MPSSPLHGLGSPMHGLAGVPSASPEAILQLPETDYVWARSKELGYEKISRQEAALKLQSSSSSNNDAYGRPGSAASFRGTPRNQAQGVGIKCCPFRELSDQDVLEADDNTALTHLDE